MDLDQALKLLTALMSLASLVGSGIGGYFFMQKTRAETSNLKAEALAIQESLRKVAPDTKSKHEFPELSKPHWLSFVGLWASNICLFLFLIAWLALPFTAHMITLIIALSFVSIFNFLNVGFYEIQRQAENNRRIHGWLTIHILQTAQLLTQGQGLLFQGEEKIIESTDVLAQGLDQIFEKLDESPGNHSGK